jgi:hypothetical protein
VSALARYLRGEPNPDHIAVPVDDCSFRLSPLRVLRRVHPDTGRSPLGRQGVGVVNEQGMRR